jgi:SAM-dependent methyltransferase
MTLHLFGFFLLIGLPVFAVGFGTYGYFIWRNQVPVVMLPRPALAQVVQALRLGPHEVFYDLGSGTGRVLAVARAKEPDIGCVGVENNTLVWLVARLRLPWSVRLQRGDIMQQDLSKATRVFVYLGPGLMDQLEPKFERELPAGARVVSVQFPLPGRKPDQTTELVDGLAHARRMYVYDF